MCLNLRRILPYQKGGIFTQNYQAVTSGLDIAKQIADFLERMSISKTDSRAAIIRNSNDVLQGRSDMSVDDLLTTLRDVGGFEHSEEIGRIQTQIEAFQCQLTLRDRPYSQTGHSEYEYRLWDFDPQRPLKVIEQGLFDHAAEHGFPPDFFKEAYFDSVDIYCMPDGADCSSSRFQDCSFTACGIRGAVFDNAAIYDSEFHSSLLRMVNFTETSIAHTHFQDSVFSSVSFQEASLKSCSVGNCKMDRVDFQKAVIDGTFFGNIDARHILNLPSATITWSGATTAEVRDLRTSVFYSLDVPMFPVKQKPLANRRRKVSAPER